MAAALSSHNDNDCIFDPALVYDGFLGGDVPVTTDVPPDVRLFHCIIMISKRVNKISISQSI